MSSSQLFVVFALAGGLILLVVGLYFFSMTRAFVAKAVRAEGTVVGEEKPLEPSDGTPSVLNASIWFAEFQDRRGLRQRYFLGSRLKLGPFPAFGDNVPPAGAKINLLFDPENPVKVRRDEFNRLWGVAIVFCVIGILCILISLVTGALQRWAP